MVLDFADAMLCYVWATAVMDGILAVDRELQVCRDEVI
jgi:hypothetical protein